MEFKQESVLFPVGILFLVDLSATITLGKGVALELALKLWHDIYSTFVKEQWEIWSTENYIHYILKRNYAQAQHTFVQANTNIFCAQ